MLKKTKIVLSIALSLSLPTLSYGQEGASARIRVANDNVTNIYLNSTCVDKNNKNIIHASKAGAGFSTWGKPKREGMPGTPGELYNGYSEYKIPAGSPITVELSLETTEARERYVCKAIMFSFIPEANADYEAWSLIDIHAKKCNVTIRKIAPNHRLRQLVTLPIPNLKPATSCEQQNTAQ